jgi:AcrR family transcriptional regulator
MRFGGRNGTGRDSYHHGNLREALVEAALRFIAERGPAGFAFAELARAVGVSTAAPYRHFRDRNALIAEVARRGFDRCAAELEQARQKRAADPVAIVGNVGRAYLAFARREPASYEAMFSPGFPLEDDAALKLAHDRFVAVLRRAADAACSGAAAEARPPSLMVALHFWAFLHGIASLFVERADGGRRALPMSPEDLLEAGLLIYLQSFGLAPQPPPQPPR